MGSKRTKPDRDRSREEMSSIGLSIREIHGQNGLGRVARLRIGDDNKAQVITLTQQPGHEAKATIQGVKSRYSHTTPSHRFRPTGQGEPIDATQVWEELDAAIANKVSPVDVAHLAVANLFFPKDSVVVPPIETI